MTKRRSGLLVGFFLASAGGTAWAQSAPAPCQLRGSTALPKNTELSTEAGESLARFTGVPVTLKVTFPTASEGGARLEVVPTSKGGFQLHGMVAANAVPMFTKRDIMSSPGHVWIAANQEVRFHSASRGRLRVTKKVLYPMDQTFYGWGNCEDFSLVVGAPSPVRQYPEGRGFMIGKPEIPLFDGHGAKASQIASITRASYGDGVFVWSSESQGGFRHIHYFGEVVIDAWAKTSDLQWMEKGEITDQQIPPRRTTNPPQLRVSGEPRVITTQSTVELRLAADEHAAQIGTIAPGTEVMVMDVVAGWASVLPKSLEVTPTGEKQFWARVVDLNRSKP